MGRGRSPHGPALACCGSACHGPVRPSGQAALSLHTCQRENQVGSWLHQHAYSEVESLTNPIGCRCAQHVQPLHDQQQIVLRLLSADRAVQHFWTSGAQAAVLAKEHGERSSTKRDAATSLLLPRHGRQTHAPSGASHHRRGNNTPADAGPETSDATNNAYPTTREPSGHR